MSKPPLVWATPQGVKLLSPANPPEETGAKALGLLSIPRAWVPPFFVLSPDFWAAFAKSPAEDRRRLVASWASLFEKALEVAHLSSDDVLYLRSNAVRETLAERGRLRSLPCKRAAWQDGLFRYFESCNAHPDERVGVLVQRYVKPVTTGHLSNERRVAEEYRDGVVELTDVATGVMAEHPVSFRRWRKTAAANTDALVCSRAEDLLTVLREPLALAATAKRRVHYEWVWDGSVVYVVQADQAPERRTGTSPDSLNPSLPPHQSSLELRVFRVAVESDADRSRKLRNHFLYAKHGFSQPPLYVLDNEAVFAELLGGRIPEPLLYDLDQLTNRPLVIRTSTSAGGATLLPRSDQLHSAAAAAEWMIGPFAQEIEQRGIGAGSLMLIAHHYIPAMAAAFSMGSPSQREVYIEALWGIPEGLYYYPCDAYLVDTLSVSAATIQSTEVTKFRVRKDVRFKGTFVAPNADGKFVVHSTKRPWDWKPTIVDSAVAQAIGLFTRQLAALEGKAVKVMWFLDCAPGTGLPSVLAWYHDNEADDWQTATQERARNAQDEILELRETADLEDLERKAESGYRPEDARRLVVSLNPVEDQFIRNELIAERVGKAARQLKAVVELRGGVLSHLYYVLRRTGADVSVRNRPRFALPPERFHKLVRDKIPGAVAAGGEFAKIVRLPPDQLTGALKIKLVEEAFEARDATPENLIGELADVLEVVDALRKASGIGVKELDSARRAKRVRRGGFDEGVVLLETSHSRLDPEMPGASMLPIEAPTGVLETLQLPALEAARQGPFDVREIDDFVEFVHSLSIALTYTEWSLASPHRLFLKAHPLMGSIEWTVEGKREGALLKLRLKIRIGTQQLELPFASNDAGGGFTE
jgi:Uncharacterized conserved protein